ncbi:MAG: hypothetical protein ACK4SO_02060 [Candidatus Kapaibacteriota bacterium]
MHIEKNSNHIETKIEELFNIYKEFEKSIKTTLSGFADVSKEDFFYELCYCLLTPATQAKHAEAVVQYLKENNFFEKGYDPRDILRGKVFKDKKIYIRFHNQKASRLLLARKNWKVVANILESSIPINEKREELVKFTKGLGYKEASHFLRNIGYKGLAVLDRHILRNMVDFGLLSSVPNVGSRKNYLYVEQLFLDFALSIGFEPEVLDLLLWAKETGYVGK